MLDKTRLFDGYEFSEGLSFASQTQAGNNEAVTKADVVQD